MSRVFLPQLRLLAILLLGLFAAGCGKPMSSLNRLAAEGSIDQSAPLTADVAVEIAAPQSHVWALLVNAPAWPTWGQEIQRVDARGPLRQGTSFSWTTGGFTIHSQVQRFVSERSLGWTGTTWTAKAIHQWTLEPVIPGRTRVVVRESMEGLWMAKLYSSRELTETINLRLLALKRAAEQTRPVTAAPPSARRLGEP